MSGLTESRLDQFLLSCRKAGIFIPLKAIVTQQNQFWNSYELYRELNAEHAKMTGE